MSYNELRCVCAVYKLHTLLKLWRRVAPLCLISILLPSTHFNEDSGHEVTASPQHDDKRLSLGHHLVIVRFRRSILSNTASCLFGVSREPAAGISIHGWEWGGKRKSIVSSVRIVRFCWDCWSQCSAVWNNNNRSTVYSSCFWHASEFKGTVWCFLVRKMM